MILFLIKIEILTSIVSIPKCKYTSTHWQHHILASSLHPSPKWTNILRFYKTGLWLWLYYYILFSKDFLKIIVLRSHHCSKQNKNNPIWNITFLLKIKITIHPATWRNIKIRRAKWSTQNNVPVLYEEYLHTNLKLEYLNFKTTKHRFIYFQNVSLIVCIYNFTDDTCGFQILQ
jgi:hypothetical protein